MSTSTVITATAPSKGRRAGKLTTLTTIGANVVGAGMFNSLALSDMLVPFAMARAVWLPKSFTKLNRFCIPQVSVIVGAAEWAAVLTPGFVKLIEFDVAIRGLILVLEFAAPIALRVKEPATPQRSAFPGGMPGAVPIAIGLALLIGLVVFDSLYHHVAYVGFQQPNTCQHSRPAGNIAVLVDCAQVHGLELSLF
jgi:amino acid transporter